MTRTDKEIFRKTIAGIFLTFSCVAFAFMVFFLVWLFLTAMPARAHEHKDGETPEQARVVNFLRSWMRPRGDFMITHRISPCCYATGLNQDCFPVAESRKESDGHLWVRPDAPGTFYNSSWYDTSKHHVSEVEQEDPRESPDGRSYVCIIGTEVACFVPGSGQ